MQAYWDVLFYKTSPNEYCITEEFLRKHYYRKPEKVAFLKSMLDSKLGLFEITGIDSSEGYVYLKEVFTGAEYKIIDIALSGATHYKNVYLYTRIITVQDISFGSGLSICFDKSDDFIINHIAHYKDNYDPSGELLRLIQLHNQYSTSHDKIRVVTNDVIKAR